MDNSYNNTLNLKDIYRNWYFSYGRSKSTLIAVILLLAFPTSTLAASADPANHSLYSKIIIALTVAIVVHAAIPAVKFYLSRRSMKRSYIAYIKASIESTMVRFGKECSIYYAKKVLPKEHHEADWLLTLEKEGHGVPDILLTLCDAFDKAEASVHNEKLYIPIITYSGMDNTELDHNHPVWTLKRDKTRLISDYLLSQRQIIDSTKAQHEKPLVELIHSDDPENHKRWIAAGRQMLGELVEHYIATQRLSKKINGS